MKKKNRFIRWLPFICATLLLLGSSMTVFAATVYHIPSDLDVENYNYIICTDGDKYYCYAVLNNYSFYGYSNGIDNCYKTNSKSLIKWVTNDMSDWGDTTTVRTSSGMLTFVNSNGQFAVASNVDILEISESGIETGKIFFQRPPVPIAELAMPLTVTVQTQTKIIVPIAVCCLALLIGSIVLLPRLRLFLLR